MMIGSRLQDKWDIPPDNSCLSVQPGNEQVFGVSQFTEHFQHYLGGFEKVLEQVRARRPVPRTLTVVSERGQLFQVLSCLEKGQYLLVETFSEKTLSYKGYVAWLLLANDTGCYLIDSGSLHDEIIILQPILEDAGLPKLALHIEEVANNLKRDFGIFPINVFCLDWLGFSHPKLKDAKHTIHDSIEQLMEANSKIFVQRPIPKELLALIKKYYHMMNQHLQMLPYPPVDQPHSYDEYILNVRYYYEYCNDSQRTLLSYEHQSKLPVHDETCENYNRRQESLTHLLFELREHLSKIRDISPVMLMPNHVLKEIVEDNVQSILEISQVYEKNQLNVGMEVYNKIYNTIQLNEYRLQDLVGLPFDFLEKYVSTPMRERGDQSARDVKKLLREIEWGESSEWLNRKNDPSIRLYKEIISIAEFDESIYEEFIDEMKGEALPKEDLEKYLKYAEYMRGKNKRRLKEYYEMKAREDKETKGKRLGRKLFEEDFDFMEQVMENDDEHLEEDDDPKKGANRALFGDWDDAGEEKKEESPKFPTLKMFKSSSVRLEERLDKKDKFFIETSKNKTKESDTAEILIPSSISQSRKSSDAVSSQNIYEEEPQRSSIKPLPDNIEQIYNQAIEAKKKITKKNTKKKDKKDHRIMKKQIEFVPTQKDIRYILQLKDNNLK